MKLFSRERKVISRQRTTYSHRNPPGSGHCEEHKYRQYLVDEYRVLGVCVWRSILDWEEVPAFAWIQQNTVGWTDWRSKFADRIRTQRNGNK